MLKKVSDAAAHKLGKLDAQLKICQATIEIMNLRMNALLQQTQQLVRDAGIDPATKVICTEEDQVLPNGTRLEFRGVYSKHDNSPVEETINHETRDAPTRPDDDAPILSP